MSPPRELLTDLDLVDERLELGPWTLALLRPRQAEALLDEDAFDHEEFLPGLLCIATLVPSGDDAPSNLCIAVQAPVMRLDAAKAKSLLPALQRAAQALSRIDADAASDRVDHARA